MSVTSKEPKSCRWSINGGPNRLFIRRVPDGPTERDETDWYRDTDVTPDLKKTRNRCYDVLSPVVGGVGENWHPDAK